MQVYFYVSCTLEPYVDSKYTQKSQNVINFISLQNYKWLVGTLAVAEAAAPTTAISLTHFPL